MRNVRELLSNILKFALENHYPKNHTVVDGTDYPSKTEKYMEWFDSTYANGGWYIGEELPEYFVEYTRRILKVFCLHYDDTDKENTYGIGVIVENFKPTQEMKLIINNDSEVEYVFKNYKRLTDNTRVYGELLNSEPINNVQITVDELIEDHVKYKGISSTTYNLDEMNTMEYNDFITNYTEKMSRIQEISTTLLETSPNPTFKVRFNIPEHTGGVADFYMGGNIGYTMNFEATDNEISFTTVLGYSKCRLRFNEGSSVIFNIDTRTLHDWTRKEYIVKY